MKSVRRKSTGWVLSALAVVLVACGNDKAGMPRIDFGVPSTTTLASLSDIDLQTRVCKGVEAWYNDSALFDFDNRADCAAEAVQGDPAACDATFRSCIHATFYNPGSIDHDCQLAMLTPTQTSECTSTFGEITACMDAIRANANAVVEGFHCGSTTIDQVNAARDPVTAAPTVPECGNVAVACLETLLSL